MSEWDAADLRKLNDVALAQAAKMLAGSGVAVSRIDHDAVGLRMAFAIDPRLVAWASITAENAQYKTEFVRAVGKASVDARTELARRLRELADRMEP